MLKKLAALTAMIGCMQMTFGQRISYFVSFPNLAHHEARISLIVSDIPSRTAVFRMSRSSPGRYATHEFGKNVYDVKAFDQQNKPLTIVHTDGDIYEVPRAGTYIRVEYTLYGNYPDGTYVGIDPERVHLNMPGAFMWVKGLDNTPISIHFTVPDSLHWTVATQLEPTNDPFTFTARGLQYFMDCPTKIGPLQYRSWEVHNPDGKKYAFRIALDGAADPAIFTAFTEKVKKLVQQEQAVFGETPAYDYGSYTFLASINPYVQWDGMEHRNSTMISIPETFDGTNGLLGVFAHEFFHCWNVKRIRPRSIEPFNFEKSNMSSELWFAEGFTQYYGELLLLRSGVGTDTDYVKNTAAPLINVKMITPGARFYSPVEASRMAVFVDAGVSVDRTNYPNIYSSYYPYGGAIALALDLELREKYHKTLDDVMQTAWKKFGKPEVPYSVPGLEEALAAVTDRDFAHAYFEKYIYGHEPIDYNTLLAPAGFQLKKKDAGYAWMGALRFAEKDGLVITSNTVIGTPLYEAGLDIDDKILTLDELPVKDVAAISRILEAHHPGDQITIRFRHQDHERVARMTLQENPVWEAVTFEKAGLPVTPEILLFRKLWLGPKPVVQ